MNITMWLKDILRYGFTPSMRKRSREVELYVEKIEVYQKELLYMAKDEAKNKAEQILATSIHLKVTPYANDLPTVINSLGDCYQHFFKKYSSVSSRNGASGVVAHEIQDYPWASGYIEIGIASEHVHLLAKENDDTVYLVADDVSEEDMILTEFPSIYHWILATQRSDELLYEKL